MDLENTLEMHMKIEYYSLTDQGTREYQQDAAYGEVQENLGMAVLCDGMGGLNGGEMASDLGVKYFARDLKDAWPVRNIPAFLQQEAHRLDQMIAGLRDKEGRPLRAGTTIVSAVLVENQAFWLSVGDSRIYLLRNGQMRCLTAAHNYKTMLQEKLEAGLIDMDYYNGEISQGEALTSYLGMGNISLIDGNANPLELEENDILLLCSDGLYKTLTDEQIQALIQESGSNIRIAGQRLLETARRCGRRGQDNTTLVLLKYGANKS